jgi:hypothetical protein
MDSGGQNTAGILALEGFDQPMRPRAIHTANPGKFFDQGGDGRFGRRTFGINGINPQDVETQIHGWTYFAAGACQHQKQT